MRLSTIYLLLFMMVLSPCVYSQGLSSYWISGYLTQSPLPFGNSNLDFNQGAPIIYYQQRNLNFERTLISMSDSAGNLIFYSNGFAICNSNSDTMINGKAVFMIYSC